MRVQEFIFSWGFIFLSALADCLTIYLVKWRANTVGRFEFNSLAYSFNYVLTFVQHPLVWVAGISFFVSPLFGYVALTRLNLTVAYPVSVTLHMLFTFGFGFILLQEPFSGYKLIGIAFLFTGLYFFFKN